MRASRDSHLGLLAVTVVALACGSSPSELVTVAGPKRFESARITIDGQFIGTLEPLRFGSLLTVLERLYGSSLDVSGTVALNIAIGPLLSRSGPHRVVLQAKSGRALSGAFEFPFRGGEEQCLVFALSDHLDISDSCRPHGAGARPARER